jgi:hypothetical protein
MAASDVWQAPDNAAHLAFEQKAARVQSLPQRIDARRGADRYSGHDTSKTHAQRGSMFGISAHVWSYHIRTADC